MGYSILWRLFRGLYLMGFPSFLGQCTWCLVDWLSTSPICIRNTAQWSASPPTNWLSASRRPGKICTAIGSKARKSSPSTMVSIDYRPMKRKIPASIMLAPRHDHALLRRQLSHGFSDRSMRDQEPIVGSYVDLLIKRLCQHGGDGAKALNIREWLNWTTFDIIGHLGFGSSFGCLENSDYHPWVRSITRTVKIGSYIQAIYELGGIQLVTWIVDSGIWTSRSEHKRQVNKKLAQRIQLDAERPDLIEGLIRKQIDLVTKPNLCHTSSANFN